VNADVPTATTIPFLVLNHATTSAPTPPTLEAQLMAQPLTTSHLTSAQAALAKLQIL